MNHWVFGKVKGHRTWTRTLGSRTAGVMEWQPSVKYGLACKDDDVDCLGSGSFPTLLEAMALGDAFLEGGVDATVGTDES